MVFVLGVKWCRFADVPKQIKSRLKGKTRGKQQTVPFFQRLDTSLQVVTLQHTRIRAGVDMG